MLSGKVEHLKHIPVRIMMTGLSVENHCRLQQVMINRNGMLNMIRIGKTLKVILTVICDFGHSSSAPPMPIKVVPKTFAQTAK